ncbi:MAG TPA: TIGR00296 family protein [Nitrososphaera sp.]|nr:TIGR00296 family protein [Nitrososphaera sp.]
MSISDIEGSEIVRLARRAVETYLRDSTIINLDKDDGPKVGVFVTLNYLTRNGEEHLRGCIGFPLPEKMLRQSVVEAAIAAATEDPRFPPVDIQELDNIIFEVSVLTPPQEIKVEPDEYRKVIKIGRDGLILRWRYGSGLLLPQVPVEMKWNIDQYLANICYKAGAPVDVLKDHSSRLYKFQAIVFKEKEPRGQVVRLEL